MRVTDNSMANSWSILVWISATFLVIFVPLDLHFDFAADGITYWLNIGCYLVLVMDLPINISWYYNQKQNPLYSENRNLRHYLQRWFWVDLLAALPVILLFISPFWQLLSILKLLKVASFMNYLRQIEVKIANVLTLLFFLYWIALGTHWSSCGWLALRGIDEGVNDFTNYLLSAYWTVTTFTTVGYGDIIPRTNGQVAYAMLIQLLGVGVYSYLIGNIASLLSRKDPAKTQYLENIEKLSALIQYRNLPMSLQARIRDYYTYMWKQRLGYDESDFLDGLPDNLQTEVALHLKKDVIDRIPLFRDTGRDFIREVALRLEPIILTPGDLVVEEGAVGNEMFFVIRGVLEAYSTSDNETLSLIQGGDFFGEIALFMNKPRTASIRARSYCDLYKLDRDAFDRIVKDYPLIAAQIENKAKDRDQRKL